MKTKKTLGPRDYETTDQRTTERENFDGRILVTRRGLAVALGVSLRTVERMLHDEEIEPVRLRGSVRFHVPDVLRALTATAITREHGRQARAVEG
jgi:excisionase family DNA binding protein